jgi:flagellar basal-body rod modification protein FlgD
MATVTSTQSILPSSFSTSTSTAPQSKADQQKNQFLQLLVAQMKGQNPLDPQDGTQFVSQLAQFSSLEELINIRTDLDGMSKTATAAASNTAANAPTSTNSTVNPFQGVQQ